MRESLYTVAQVIPTDHDGVVLICFDAVHDRAALRSITVRTPVENALKIGDEVALDIHLAAPGGSTLHTLEIVAGRFRT